MSKLKDKVEEFAEIAKSLPDNLQVTCFELLLRNHLEGGGHPPSESKAARSEAATTPPGPGPLVATTPPAEAGSKQEDLKSADLHLKAKKFIEKHALSLGQLNNLFFKEDGQLKPLYDDLKTTRTSESQIRLTLLLALQTALTTGEFEADVEAVRQDCVARKCYDGNNFSNNYNNNKSLFKFDKYTKATKSVRLSEAGRDELASVIQELQ
jgi:hypothetical protein